MRFQTMKTLLAVLALALGLAGQASAQTSSEARRVVPPKAKPQTAPKEPAVKITETPAEETPAAPAQPAAPAAAAAPAAGPAQGSQPRDEMAITAGREWLALVDAGQYAEGYDQAGDLFRGSLARDQWAAALGNSRKPHGNVAQRNLKSVVVTKDLSNAPQGKYVVITFETTFQQPTEPLWEVVTTYLNASGQWKVVGYQVKPQEAGKPAK